MDIQGACLDLAAAVGTGGTSDRLLRLLSVPHMGLSEREDKKKKSKKPPGGIKQATKHQRRESGLPACFAPFLRNASRPPTLSLTRRQDVDSFTVASMLERRFQRIAKLAFP